jgi:hypothetical protein
MNIFFNHVTVIIVKSVKSHIIFKNLFQIYSWIYACSKVKIKKILKSNYCTLYNK